jgi:hypothetical protein
MQEFAMNHIKKNRKINPNWLAADWYQHKNGRLPPAASRGRWGITSAAYKTLRSLESKGLVESNNDYEYQIKTK